MSTLTRDDLAARLLALPEELAAAEREALRLQCRVTAAKDELADFEAGLMIRGVAGSNAEQRAAHVRLISADIRHALQQAQEDLAGASVRLRILQEEGKALRACARLLAGVDED